jgi:beta-galactosidase
MKKLPLLFSLALLVATGLRASPPSERSLLDLSQGWKFALKPAGSGFESIGFDDKSWVAVQIPHTWNALDGQDGGAYFRGDGWYRLKFPTLPAWQGQRVFFECDGANKVAEVWLNGRLLGRHAGGYARFRFDLTSALATPGENLLVIRVNNESNEIIPLGGDFTMFGGIYRNARLVTVDPIHLALLDYASSGVYLDTHDITSERAQVDLRALVTNDSDSNTHAVVRTILRDAADRSVVETETPVELPAGKTSTIKASLALPHPELWRGRTAPYLYHAEVTVIVAGRETDRVIEAFGVRTFAFDPEKGFSLNGRPYSLHGVNRHQDRINKGYAISDSDRREDMALIEEMGATTIRLCHYQHDPFFYDLCDQRGMVVWAELAFVSEMIEHDAAFADNAAEQLRELIRQNYNRPSIACWSVGNETTNEQMTSATALLGQLAAIVKTENPHRPSTYASHHDPSDTRNFVSDLLAFNKYFGWYAGDYAKFGPWLDEFHAKNPTRPIGISEYGAGASVFQHEQNPPPRPKTQAKGPWHPEEWQNEYHEQSWLALKARPYLWGTYIWNMFDFAADWRSEGDTSGRNDKGLVTYDRRTRKDAFFWYKANWTTEPLVYITSRRDVLRVTPKTDVKIYSNCDSVELWLNGTSLGRKTSNDRRFIWKDVALVMGPNRLYAEAQSADKKVTDSCAWTRTTGEAYLPAPEPATPVKK